MVVQVNPRTNAQTDLIQNAVDAIIVYPFPARALYTKLGYKEAGRRSAYYAGERGPVDAIVMRRTLPRPIV